MNENEQTNQDADPLFVVNVNGEDVAVDKIKVGNEEIDATKWESLKSSSMMQSDYTRKMQELSDSRNKLQSREKQISSFESLKTLAEHDSEAAASMFQKIIQNNDNSKKNSKDSKNLDNAEINDLRLTVAEMSMQAHSELGPIYTKHRDKILEYATKHLIGDLEIATTSWAFANRKTLENEVERKDKKADASGESQNRRTGDNSQFSFDKAAVNRSGGFAEQFNKFNKL